MKIGDRCELAEERSTVEISEDELLNGMQNTMSGKDVTSTKAKEYPIKYPFLKFCADPVKEKVLGLMDLLTNEALIIELPRKYGHWEKIAGFNEISHANILTSSYRQRGFSFLMKAIPEAYIRSEIMDTWRDIFEAVALYGHLTVQRLSHELEKMIMDWNARLFYRVMKITKIVEKVLLRHEGENVDLSDWEIAHLIGKFLLAFSPLVRENRKEILFPDIDGILKYVSQLEQDDIAVWKNNVDLSRYLQELTVSLQQSMLSKVIKESGSGIFEAMPLSLEKSVKSFKDILVDDTNKELKMYIYGFLNDFGLVYPVIYYCDKEFNKKRVKECVMAYVLDREGAHYWVPSQLHASPDGRSLLKVRQWIHDKCPRDCATRGRKDCPIRDDVYGVTKKFLGK